MENHCKGRGHWKDKLHAFPRAQPYCASHQTVPTPSLFASFQPPLGTLPAPADPTTLESYRAWTSGCVSVTAHSPGISCSLAGFKSYTLMSNPHLQPDLPAQRHPDPTACLTSPLK